MRIVLVVVTANDDYGTLMLMFSILYSSPILMNKLSIAI